MAMVAGSLQQWTCSSLILSYHLLAKYVIYRLPALACRNLGGGLISVSVHVPIDEPPRGTAWSLEMISLIQVYYYSITYSTWYT